MKNIKLFDEIAKKNELVNLTELGIHPTVYWAYRNSLIAKNDILNFSDIIWEKDIPSICKYLESLNIEEFTISSDDVGIKELCAFKDNGYDIVSQVKIQSASYDCNTGKNIMKPAIKFALNKGKWESGSFKIKKNIVKYNAKVYNNVIENGLDGGKISKLTLTINDVIAADYDNGSWNIKPCYKECIKAIDMIIEYFK